MNRRDLLCASASIPLVSGCVYDRWFDLEWDEEVLLHDGSVIVVHLKHRYQRLSSTFSRYGGLIATRDTRLTFDAGGDLGRVAQDFKGFHPMFLDRFEGQWYAVLYGSYYNGSRQLPGQDWGELEGPYGQWAIKLVRGTWLPMSMGRLPEPFQEPNMLMLYGKAVEHAGFDGKRVTLADKSVWLARHPLGYAHIQLTRPTAASPRRADSVIPIRSGEKK